MAKSKKKSNRLYLVLLLFFLAVMTFSGIMIIKELLEYNTGDAQYTELVTGVVTERPKNQPDDQPAGPPVQVDFSTLQQQNSEVVGWLYNADTVISYPVVQTTDNDYYLTHLFDGTENKMGAVFMDYKNDAGMNDRNTILYGHHMKNGSIFASLVEYQEQAYYEQHKELFYATPQGDYRVEVYAGFLAEGSEAVPISFDSDEAFLDYAAGIKDRSTFDSGITLDSKDRLLTLYTCTYEFSDARYLLVGRLIPWEEKAESNNFTEIS